MGAIAVGSYPGMTAAILAIVLSMPVSTPAFFGLQFSAQLVPGPLPVAEVYLQWTKKF